MPAEKLGVFMKIDRFSLVLALAALSAIPASAQILLEDFSSMRKNGDGTDLWFTPTKEDPIQSYTLENGMMKVMTGPEPNGVYMTFLPYNYGYTFPTGYVQNYIRQGAWNPNVNRFRFSVKCSNTVMRSADGSDNLQIGTYIKPKDSTDARWQGDHYYHLLDANFYANRWTTIELNRVPQHMVTQSPYTNWPENPESGINYYDGLTIFYFDTQGSGWGNQTCYFDNYQFGVTTGEPDTYVSSLAGSYNESGYDVTWAAPKNSVTSYEVRYSTSSMKANGFASGMSGGTVSSPGNAYTGTFWRSPSVAEAPVMYVAIRPTDLSQFTEFKITSSPDATAPSVPVTSGCDVNKDGSVNQTDVNSALDQALGKASCSTDLDGDGQCTVVDVQRVINASLGQSCRAGQ
jgi:hypothetical protein